MAKQQLQLCLFGLCFLAAYQPQNAREPGTWADVLGTEISGDWASAEYRSFDFWIGEWEMHWRPPVKDQLKTST